VAVIELTTVIRAPLEQVFDICVDVDVHSASMAGSSERVVAGVASGRMALGESVTWSARHFGVRWRMTSRITAYDRPRRFVDEQVAGPFRHWHHEHTFSWDATAKATVMRDVIQFVVPLGALGRLVDAILLERYMRRLIEKRNGHLARLLESGSPP
jgi:ligand-binding SRPBCC domain-containing protein